MLYQLSSTEFGRAQPVFGSDSDHLAVVSALAGESPAELFVDDPQCPRAGLLLLWNERVYLAGEPGDTPFARACAALLRERFAPREVGEAGEAYTERSIAYDPPEWEAYLPAIFGDLASRRVEREDYHLHLTAPLAAPALPGGFRVRPVDAALVAESALGNHEALLDESQSEAPSVEAFLAQRFGSCIQQGNDLVAWCLSEYNHGERCELGIETLPRFRRQGLALAAAQATIAHAQRVGITEIGWHCWKSNTPSSALARKLGFAHARDYAVWVVRFTQPRA